MPAGCRAMPKMLGAGFAGPRFVHNSALIFSHTCLGVVLPDDGAVIPDRADGVGYWPMSIAKVSRPGSTWSA
jgi:hypothetical protein